MCETKPNKSIGLFGYSFREKKIPLYNPLPHRGGGGWGALPTLEWIVAVWVRLQLVVQTLAAAEAGCGALPLWCGKSKSWCVRLSK